MEGCATLDAWRAAILTRLTDPCLFDFYCTLDRAPNYAELIGQVTLTLTLTQTLSLTQPFPKP